MLRILGWIVAILVLAVAGLFAYAATRPDTFHVERSITIAAPPDKAFALISDFREWPKWSPWEKLDPGMQKTLSGAPTGVGAVYAWKGNSDVGEGRMEVAEANPPGKVVIRIDFKTPMEASNIATFDIAAEGTGSKVTWSMDGAAPLITRALDVIFGLDAMIGGDFEKGLAALKAEAEKG